MNHEKQKGQITYCILVCYYELTEKTLKLMLNKTDK